MVQGRTERSWRPHMLGTWASASCCHCGNSLHSLLPWSTSDSESDRAHKNKYTSLRHTISKTDHTALHYTTALLYTAALTTPLHSTTTIVKFPTQHTTIPLPPPHCYTPSLTTTLHYNHCATALHIHSHNICAYMHYYTTTTGPLHYYYYHNY